MAVTKVSRDRHEEIIERYRAGETAEIIGSAHGLTRQGVCRILDRHGVARRARGNQPKPLRLPAASAHFRDGQIRRPPMTDISGAMALAVRIRDNGYAASAGEAALLAQALLIPHEEHPALRAAMEEASAPVKARQGRNWARAAAGQ